MTFPFAQLRLTISMHIHAITNSWTLFNFCIIVDFALCWVRFGCVRFGLVLNSSSKKNDQRLLATIQFHPVSPQLQSLTPKIQCNMQIVRIRLTKIIDIGNLFNYCSNYGGDEAKSIYRILHTARVCSDVMMSLFLCLRCFEGSFAFRPTGVRPVTKY